MLRSKFDRLLNSFVENVINMIVLQIVQQIDKAMITCYEPHITYQIKYCRLNLKSFSGKDFAEI